MSSHPWSAPRSFVEVDADVIKIARMGGSADADVDIHNISIQKSNYEV